MSQYSILTTPYLNCYTQITPQGLSTIWNGTSFESYTVGNWTSYDQAVTESAPGRYYGEWPAFTDGYYDITVFQRVGTLASSTDPILGGDTQYYTDGTVTAPDLPNYSAAWYAKTPFSPNVSVGTLTIAAGANEYLGWDFSNYPQVERGEVISSVNITCSSCTVTGSTYGGGLALARFSGTALSAVATVSVTATFSGGDSVVHTGSLSIV